MYRSGVVPAALRGAVRSIAAYDETSPGPRHRREIPHGGCTLVLGLGVPIDLDGPGGRSRPAAFLAGLHEGPVHTTFTGRQCGVQVDLTPFGALRLLGGPADALTGHVPALDALGVPELAALPARLADDDGWDRRLAHVGSTLAALLADAAAVPDPEVARAWHRLRRASGRVPVGTLAAEVGWSRRHLLTRFRRQVGLTPTAAGRVLRLRRAAGLLLPGSGPDRSPSGRTIADVAAAAGYADHAHLDREFVALAGCAPSTWLREQRFPDVQATAPASS